MTQADSVHSTPPINTSANNVKSQEKALARQEAQRQRALKRIRKLRMKAADEIDRLLEFLDAVDDTDVDSQCDDDPIDEDELDGPENDEDEQSEPDEPSLGSGAVGEWSTQTLWSEGAANSRAETDCEAEHDGAEPDEDGEPSLGSSNDSHGNGTSYEPTTSIIDAEGPEDDLEPSIGYDVEPAEQDTGNDEPSLGWTDEEAARGRTYAGSYGNSTDCEQGEPARKPQNRTTIDREPITVEVSYRRFLRGLTPDQRKKVKAARKGHGNDVILA